MIYNRVIKYHWRLGNEKKIFIHASCHGSRGVVTREPEQKPLYQVASSHMRVISVSKHRADYGTRLDRMAKCVEFHTKHFGL